MHARGGGAHRGQNPFGFAKTDLGVEARRQNDCRRSPMSPLWMATENANEGVTFVGYV